MSQQNFKFYQTREFLQRPSYQNEEAIPNLGSETHITAKLMVARATTSSSDLDEQIRSMITKSDISEGPGKGPLATCNVCGKQRSYRNMPAHVKTRHITGLTHSCEICGKTFRTRHSLNQHIISQRHF